MLNRSIFLHIIFVFLSLHHNSTAKILIHFHPPVSTCINSSKQPLYDSISSRQNVYTIVSNCIKTSQNIASQYIIAITQNIGYNVEISSLWISNTLIVDEIASLKSKIPLLSTFLQLNMQYFPGVISIEPDMEFFRQVDAKEEIFLHSDDKIQSNIQWMHAPELWQIGVTGDGIVIANIDSGVRYTHETLWSTFRGNKDTDKAFGYTDIHSRHSNVSFDYAFWFAPGTNMSNETPDTADPVGHGTHTMGTAVGINGIGMAPNATWITARAFDEWGRSTKSTFLLAAQWVLCPTKLDGSSRDCSKGANIVSNSFGIPRSSADISDWTWMSHIIQIWIKAGVYPVFASGNTNGFLCGSVYYPASETDTIAVGALVGGKTLWGASGKGPVLNHGTTIIKPDFVAPGVGIRSALSTSNNAYTRLTGTSMATPHIAGGLALLLSIKNFQIETQMDPTYVSIHKILEYLYNSTGKDLKKPFLVPNTCGNTTYSKYPNNIYGYGRPNFCAAATLLGKECQDIQIQDQLESVQ